MKTTRADYADVQALLESLDDDEPIFIIRGQDRAAQVAIQAWINRAYALKASDAILTRATETKREVDRYQQQHGSKVPDVPENTMTDEERAEFHRVVSPPQLGLWQRLKKAIWPDTAVNKQSAYEASRVAWRKEHGIPDHSGRSTKLPNSR